LAVSLLLSMLSRHLRPKPPVSPSSSTSLERQEYARRDREMLWNAFRGEIWTGWTRPKLDGMRRSMEGKPLLGLLSGIIQDWVPLVDEYYYCGCTLLPGGKIIDRQLQIPLHDWDRFLASYTLGHTLYH
jgi:peroxin-16